MRERRCYKIEVYTPFEQCAKVEYYSTCSRTRLREYAGELVDEIAWSLSHEYFWQYAKEDETEEEYAERFFKGCGVRFFDVSVEEFKAVPCAVFSFD